MSEELREKGNKAFVSKNYAEAISLYTKAIESNCPNLHLLYGNRSASLLAQGKFSEAESDARKALSVQQYASGYSKLVNALIKQNKIEESCKVLMEAGKIFPNDAALMTQIVNQSHQTLLKHNLWTVECENPAFDIKIVENKGRGLVANRDIKQGEIIFSEYPLVICSNNIFSGSPFCSYCGKKIKEQIDCSSKSCPTHYCSVKCKNLAWETYHQPVCVKEPGIIQFYNSIQEQVTEQQHSPFELYAVSLLGYFIQLTKKCGNPSEAWLAVTSRFYGESYNQILQKEGKQMVDCTSFIESLPKGNWSPYATKENFEYLAGMAYLDCNSLIVRVEDQFEEIGSGLFVMQTLLNHSCSDNVEIIAAGTTKAKIEIEANRDIKVGEELCSSYNKMAESNEDQFTANLYDSLEVHKQKLMNTWGITCNCNVESASS